MRDPEISDEVLALFLNKLEVAEVEGMNSSQVKALSHFDPGGTGKRTVFQDLKLSEKH